MIKRIVAVILFLVFSLTSKSQINVSVGWDKDTIDLGGEVDLMLFVKGHPGVKIDTVSGGFLDSLISGFQTIKIREADSTRSEDFAYADSEILSYGKFTINDDDDLFVSSELNWEQSQVGGELLLTNRFKIRIWDPGQIIANNPRISYTISGQKLEKAQNFQAALFVRPPIDVATMEKDSFDISPIKTIIKEPINWSDYRYFVWGLLGLLALASSYLLFKKYQSKKEAQPKEEIKIIIPAHEIALDKLHLLDEKKLWQTDIKGYQSELTYVVREYLENRYEIPALESTTDEIVSAIKNKSLDASLITEMKNILHVADLVKFAKSKPSLNIHQEFMDKAFEFVKETQVKIEEPEEIRGE